MSMSPDPPPDTCPNCGQPEIAAFCSSCGEKRRSSADWELAKMAGEAVEEITDFEHSKVWQTLRLLVLSPGQLTREHWRGRRKPFLGPVKLYLIFFAISLVLYSIHQPTAVYDVRTLAANPRGTFSSVLERRANERGMSVEQFAQELNVRWQRYISMSQLIYPFAVALVMKLLFLRRKFYFAQHLIFALHLLAFTLLSMSLLWPLYVMLGIKPSLDQFTQGYFLVTGISLAWTMTYLLLAMRRTYEERWWPTVIKGSIVFVTYFATSAIFLSAAFMVAIGVVGRSG